MKFISIITLIFFTHPTWAVTDKEADKLIASLADFSEKEKLTEKDLPEITQQLKNILILEKHDKSRIGPLELTISYPKNKALYQKAIKGFKKDEQKTLQDVLKIVENVAKEGNG